MIARCDVTGVVLAGGQSSRFGSNKAMQFIGNETFLMRAIRLLQPLCAEVLISGKRVEYTGTGCRLVKDLFENCGPLAGIHAALKACQTPYVLFLTCDMPLMESAPLYSMLAETDVEIVGWSSQEEKGGVFPLLLSKTLLPIIEQTLEQGKYKIKPILYEKENARIWEIPTEWLSLFTNINRKEDLDIII